MTATPAPLGRIGFIGTGVLAASVIDGLLSQKNHGIDSIVVSPRSEATSIRLAVRHNVVSRADTNQEVIDCSDTIVLAIRPQHVGEVLADLEFRPNQTIISFVIGVVYDDLYAMVQPAARLVQLMPLPMIALGVGPIVIYPAAPDIEALFEPLGDLVVAREAQDVARLSVGGGLMATFFAQAKVAIDWMQRDGLSPETARDYLMSMYSALSQVGAATPFANYPDLPKEYATPGGINEACLRHLTEAGWFTAFEGGLSAMAYHRHRLERGDTDEARPRSWR